MSARLPHEIRKEDGSPIYRCRACRTDANLRWYRATSCPVCEKPECTQVLDAEWAAAYEDLQADEEWP